MSNSAGTTVSQSSSQTQAKAVELEYFLLGSALASYGAKLMCGSVPTEVKKLGDDQTKLKSVVNDFSSIEKHWNNNNKNNSSNSSTGGGATTTTCSDPGQQPHPQPAAEQQLHAHIHENCRCEIVEDWTKPGPDRDERLYELIKSQVSDPNGSLNAHAPHFVFKVVPHTPNASGYAGTQRIAKEFSSACTAATQDREQRKSGELPNKKCSHRLKSAPSTEMEESQIPVTTYAMHGSKTHNWYSILHAGFRNVCAERVLYGHGVYLSTALGVCQDFAAFEPCPLEVKTADSIAKCVRPFTPTSSGFHTSNSIRCVGVVEVCHDLNNQNTRSGEYSDPDLPETYLVVKNPSLLNLKYLLVWQTGGGGAQGSSTSNSVTTTAADAETSTSSPKGNGSQEAKGAEVGNSQSGVGSRKTDQNKEKEAEGAKLAADAGATARHWTVFIRAAVLVLVLAVAAYYYRETQTNAARRRGQIRRNLL